MLGNVPDVHRFSHHAMTTLFEVLIGNCDREYAGQAAQTVFREIDRVEGLFSRFDPASEISSINRLGPGESMIVGVETFECLSLAEEAREAVGGAFDINVRALVKCPGKAGGNPMRLVRIPSGFEARRVAAPGGTSSGLLDLDLGGIGKGYALDKALLVLEDWSVGDALVHGGTSTAIGVGDAPAVKGKGGGWPVGVGAGWPCSDAPESFRLRGRALSGSGTEVKGRHVLDPATGLPAGGHLAAWASHPSAAMADALSTAFIVMATDQVEAYCRRHPETWALVVRDYGDCRVFNPEVAREFE